MEAVCASSISAKETVAFVGIGRASESELTEDLLHEIADSANITVAISESISDGKITSAEARELLLQIEHRRDQEEELLISLRNLARQGKDHG